MKRTHIVLLAAALLVTATLPAVAQEGATCNESRAEGIARSELGPCIADAEASGFNVSLGTVCNCPGTGYTVTAIGGLRDFNVIASTCGVPEG